VEINVMRYPAVNECEKLRKKDNFDFLENHKGEKLKLKLEIVF
jgi:hypothetical protein